MGIATKLLTAVENSMIECFAADSVELHVRRSNEPALHLYKKTLGYKDHSLEKGYYANGEDAFVLKHYLTCKNLLEQTNSSTILDDWKAKHPVPEIATSN